MSPDGRSAARRSRDGLSDQNPVTANQRSAPFGRTPTKKTAGARQGSGSSTRVATYVSPAGENGAIGELASATDEHVTIARAFGIGLVPVSSSRHSTSTSRLPSANSFALPESIIQGTPPPAMPWRLRAP